jgi:predicted nucleic acid-binding Zn ribbon protein
MVLGKEAEPALALAPSKRKGTPFLFKRTAFLITDIRFNPVRNGETSMTESCDNAFRVVETLAETQRSRTGGVDAFSLSLIRCESQLRRLFTSLVFQGSAFDRTHVDQLKAALVLGRRFISGISK